jgi:hypothetical protein
MKQTFILLLLFIVFVECNAQTITRKSNEIRPEWTTKTPLSHSGNYNYYIGIGTEEVLDKAIAIAMNYVIQRVNEDKGLTYQISIIDTEKMSNLNDNGTIKTNIDFTSQAVITATGEKIELKIKAIETYWEEVQRNGKSQFEVAVLVRIPKGKNDLDLAPFSYSKGHYWRSAIVPGWGQFYTKSKTKGYIILSATVATIATTTVTQLLYDRNYKDYTQATKLGGSHLDDAKIFKSNADNWKIARNISVIALGTVYVYNLVDAFTAPGNIMYAYKDPKFEFFPVYAGGFQVGMRMRF